jgi:hypothetical protein
VTNLPFIAGEQFSTADLWGGLRAALLLPITHILGGKNDEADEEVRWRQVILTFCAVIAVAGLAYHCKKWAFEAALCGWHQWCLKQFDFHRCRAGSYLITARFALQRQETMTHSRWSED